MSSNKNQKEYKIGNKTIKLHNSSNHYQNNSYQNKGNTYIDRKKYYQSKNDHSNYNNNEKRHSHHNERDHSNHIYQKRERSHSHNKEKHIHHKHEKNRRYSHSNSQSYSRENSNKNKRYSHSNSLSRSRSRDNSNNNKNYHHYYQRNKYNNNNKQFDDKQKQFKQNNFKNNQFQNNLNYNKLNYNQNFNNNNINNPNYNFKQFNFNINNPNNQNNQMIYNLSNSLPINYQSNIYNNNNNNNNNNNQYIQKTKEPSNTFLLSNLGPDINNEILEDIFREKCLEAETSMPEDIRFIESLNLAYIIFPSISVAMKLFEKLNGKIIINGSPYNLSYTPNTQQINNNRESITYVTHLIDNNSYTTSMETTVHEDWYCEYCDCKNFSRRVACFKCKRPKTLNCRIAPVIKQKTTIVGENGKIPPSTSLMVRGDSIKDSNEGEVSLIIFNKKFIYTKKKIYIFIYIY